MITLDITAGDIVPPSWEDVARMLNVSAKTLREHRRALGYDGPPTKEVVETLRRMSSFTALRNRGGGKACTRRDFVTLLLRGEEVLAERLQELGVE